MRKPDRALVLAVSLPLAAGCFSTFQAPLPEPADRSSDIRGVVRGDGSEEEGERIEFETVEAVEWTDSEVAIIGMLKDPDDAASEGMIVTRAFPLSTLSGILVRQLDAGKTSAVIGGFFVGAIATVALLVTGQARDNAPLPGVR